jgi:hypothetical protein
MINAILGSGSEINLISQEIYEKLIKAGATCRECCISDCIWKKVKTNPTASLN